VQLAGKQLGAPARLITWKYHVPLVRPSILGVTLLAGMVTFSVSAVGL
jgi:hypothetical protein